MAALAAASAGGTRAAEGGAEARASLALAADPPVLSPGQARVRLRVEGCEEALPALTVNVGVIAGVRVAGRDRAVADYLPPPEARPQIAIVAAACRGRQGWTAIPIIGRGIAVARTRPGAAIRVTIGARSFGPAVADGEGLARVPVEVPPGVRFAYQGDRPLDLRVPPASRVHVTIEPRSVRADREEHVRVRAHVVTDAARPLPGAVVRLAASSGVLTPPEEVEPGVTEATWTLAPGAAGSARLEAAVEDDPGPPGAAVLAREPGPPARIEVSADRERARAGEAPVQLDVRILDAAGNLSPARLRVEPEGAALDAREVAPGRWAVGLEVPERLGGRAALDVALRAGEATAAAGVPLAAGPAAQLAVEAARSEVVADGADVLAVRVTLQDRFGNAALDAAPAASTTHPADVETAREGEGFLVTIRPHRLLVPARDEVTVQAAGRTERVPVALRAADSFVTLSARAGYLASAGGLRSPYASAEAALWPGRWRGLGVALEGGALAWERTDGALPGVEVRGRARYFPLLASARWRGAPSPRTLVIAGAGAALAAVDAEVGIVGQPAVREGAAAPGAHASLGAGVRFGASFAFLEARALWLSDPGLQALSGRLLATGLVLGWSHGVF